MAKSTIRVYKSGGVWVAQKDGTKKASAIRNTQKEAYLAAKNIALNQGLTITVYSPTGGIQKVINPKDKSDEGNCFITTACVKYYGLEDNCYELATLRYFRDSYLLTDPENRSLVKQYYSIAPKIVQQLERDINKKKLFEEIYLQIKQACRAIEKGKFEMAKAIYMSTIINLFQHYEIAKWQ